MKHLQKSLALIILLVFFVATSGKAQMSVSYYASSLSKAGIAYNFNNRLWTELRIYSNSFIEDVTPELVFCVNMVSKENHSIYIGIGANVNYFNGPVLPLGVQFSPFDNFRRFSFHIELQPSMDLPEGDPDIILQASWGIRYRFQKDQ